MKFNVEIKKDLMGKEVIAMFFEFPFHLGHPKFEFLKYVQYDCPLIIVLHSTVQHIETPRKELYVTIIQRRQTHILFFEKRSENKKVNFS